MKSNTSSRSGLFLMELIISILFFSLAGAVCIRLFVGSHIISKDSVELNHSLEWCQNVAEVFYGCNGDVEEMATLFTNCISEASARESGKFVLAFDENFDPINVSRSSIDPSSIDSYYVVSVTVTGKEQMLHCEIKAAEVVSASKTMSTLGKITSVSDDAASALNSDCIYELTVSLHPQKEVSNEE